ncbi:probable helicase senataxin isoform X3 [Alosa sapidissima]|uniref:probable helicase senataxin isoform X3 n=1 Tax=Alosa sapidissima TaxID=34773 RepID=UPI001C08C654|nr:probable helicase senataxin isoform X3 [Alosa sapidissima]
MEICLWCTIERENVVEFLEQYAASSLSQDQFQTATEDLNNCADCVSEYHLARSEVPHLHKRLWVLETTRLLSRFSQMSEDELEDDLFIVEDNQERPVSKMTMGEFEAALRTPLIEILQYPYLLAHSKLSDLCLDALCRIESIDIKEKYKGIYLLLVHPNEKVRSWAIATARMLGCVDRDDFYDVEEVLACMFCVLELGISFSLEDSDPPSACNGKLARMPTHLYDSSNVKNYWLGICMLLTVLDAQAMNSLFLGPNKQTNILQCILNAMEEDGREFDSTSDPFWPALQCFMVILDRLGPLSWGYIDPIKAFNTITDSCSYISEIETIRSNTRTNVKEEIEDEHLVTCSQMVYATFLQQKSSKLVSDWLREDRVKLKLMVQSVDYGSLDTGLFTVTNANFTANLTPQQESQQFYPKEDDVVILWLPQNSPSYTHSPFSDEHKPDDCQPHFGVVSRSNVIIAGSRRDLKLKVQTLGNVLSVDKQQVQCEVIGSMLSAMRELNALCHIHDKSLISTILAPDKHFAHFLPASQLDPKFEGCNVDQAKAIDCGVSMVMSRQPTPKICMIHGPPGTGKSDTIVNLLYQLSQRGAADPSGQQRLHALVCAPSNAAVDNVMKKIIVFFKGQNKDGKHKGNCGDVNLVRLGSERTICEEVVAFSLDSQTRSRTVKAQVHVKSIEQKIADLEQNMENLNHMCAMAQDPAKLAQLRDKNSKLNEEREKLSHQMKQCKSGRQNTQRLILQEANIICCTLSTSGSIVLELAFRRRGRVPFNCVIIDEAGQAKETETLIPLLFRCPSLVLVGDPNQLPPTVISQKVKELGFDQSLMARLYKCIHRLSPPRIHFLSQQYRMHPDICSFPSRYIYNNLLKTDRTIAQNRCSKEWACESYRVLDVADGQEMRERDSYFNPKEVKLTVELVQLVVERYQNRTCSQSLQKVIGVITPYSGQKFRIREALRKKNLTKVVVDTVDGFQGREMDCIIVSCVRASNEMGSIGFLGNRHRMNVTITRAKYSLFVLGHLRTLREHSDWKALIEDAESRGTIITTKEQHFKTDARKIFKRDPLPPHRTQDWPSNPSNRSQLSRSNTTPPYSNTSRVNSKFRAPQSTDRPRDPRSSNTSSGTIPSRPASSSTARGQDPTDRPRDPRSSNTSSGTIPSRPASSSTARGQDPTDRPRDPRSSNTSSGTIPSRPASSSTARGKDPTDRPRDPRLQGSSLNTAPSRHPNLSVSRDRHDSYEHERRRPSPNDLVSSSTVERSSSSHRTPSDYSRRERH